jgi:hypothetical protein
MGTVENTGNDCSAYERGEQSERGVEYWQKLELTGEEINRSAFLDKWVGDQVSVSERTAGGTELRPRRWTVRGRHFHTSKDGVMLHLDISTFDPPQVDTTEMTRDELASVWCGTPPQNSYGRYPRCKPQVGDPKGTCVRCGLPRKERHHHLPCPVVPPEQRWGDDTQPAVPSPVTYKGTTMDGLKLNADVKTVENARVLKTFLEVVIRNAIEEYERKSGMRVKAVRVCAATPAPIVVVEVGL